MPIESTIPIDDRNFIPNVLREQRFRDRGYLIGQSNGVYWVVVDPVQHPLYVWSKSGTTAYVSSAKALNAVAFTNGPMMEHQSLAGRIALGAGIGFVATTGVTKYFTVAGPKGWLIALGVGLVGALVGASIALAATRRGVPFREVRGAAKNIYDKGAENTTALYWLQQGRCPSRSRWSRSQTRTPLLRCRVDQGGHRAVRQTQTFIYVNNRLEGNALETIAARLDIFGDSRNSAENL